MLTSRARILAGIAILFLLGCGDKRREADAEPKPARDAASFGGTYAGTLPCADCRGIGTELTLFTPQQADAPPVYHLRETYVATRDGDHAFTTMGPWRTARGTASDPNATVIQIGFDEPTRQRSFVVVDDRTLRALDRSGAEIDSPAPHTLARSENVAAPQFLAAGASNASLRVGQELVVQLAANRSTGYQWSLPDSTSAVLAPQGMVYVQDTPSGLAVGVGGHEYWRLLATAPGSQILRFEYRRPWETQPPPARTAEIGVRVDP